MICVLSSSMLCLHAAFDLAGITWSFLLHNIDSSCHGKLKHLPFILNLALLIENCDALATILSNIAQKSSIPRNKNEKEACFILLFENYDLQTAILSNVA